jgi:phenylalanyl-tRNA synthetase beta chain
VLPEQWGAAARHVDFYDVKSDLEAMFAPRSLTLQAAEHPASHPGRSARVLLDGIAIAWLGELHPQWQQQYDLPLPAVWCEVQLIALVQSAVPRAEDISKFPAVRRDIAVLVEEKVDVQTLLDAMNKQNAPYVTELALFDVYRGHGVEEGKKSLAFRVLLKDTQKTLTESEIEPSIAMLVEVLHKIGAKLRGK